MKAIAEEVGRDWKMMGRFLGLSEPEIQQIDHANQRNLHEAAMEALNKSVIHYQACTHEEVTIFLLFLRWRDKMGPRATVNALKKALTDLKLMNIVHKFF